MEPSLFAPLSAAGLTSLKIEYDWRTDKHRIRSSRDWDPDLRFCAYMREFTSHSVLTDAPETIGTAETRALFDEHGVGEHLDQVLELMRKGRHESIEAYHHAERGIRFMCHQHSRRLGLRTKRQAVMAGGIRRHRTDEPEIDVIIDGLNLGRAMSFKNVAANLDFGGCKTTVQMEPLELDDLESMGFLAFAIDRCRTMTGPDMNFPTAMADVINEHFSSQFTNGPGSPIGESGAPTAHGTYLALSEAVRFSEGRTDLDGMTAVVMGLGAVGWHLATELVDAGVHVTVSDIDAARIDSFLSDHARASVASIPVDEVLHHSADILCPAAIGGILDEAVIDALRYRYVFGPANNQLRASDQQEEERLARRLAERGILFQTEWWHNTGGVMAGAEEYLNGSAASPESLLRRVENTVPRRTRENLERARDLGITSTEAAYRACESVIYGEESHDREEARA